VLPGVTTTLFGMYGCIDIDPDGLVPGTPTYMQNDYRCAVVASSAKCSLGCLIYPTSSPSIACNSPRYTFGVIWASVMIVVYPVGTLGMYFFFLYKNRAAIVAIKAEEEAKERNGDGENVQEDTHGASERRQRQHGRGSILDHAKLLLSDRAWRVVSPKELTFLYEAYKGRVWYWEVLETTRCLLLTAVVSVVGFGSTGQFVFGILVAIILVAISPTCRTSSTSCKLTATTACPGTRGHARWTPTSSSPTSAPSSRPSSSTSTGTSSTGASFAACGAEGRRRRDPPTTTKVTKKKLPRPRRRSSGTQAQDGST